MSKHGSMAYQVTKILQDKFAPGESKHKAKESGEDNDFIFGFNSIRTYIREATNFCNWCKEVFGVRTVAACKPYVKRYIQNVRKKNGERYSASSLATKASAIAKLYGVQKVKTPERKLEDITRSRKPREMDKHYRPENHSDLERFCEATGTRRCEVSRIRGTQHEIRNHHLYVQIVDNQGKGGRKREIPVVKDARFVLDLMQKAGTGKVFEKIPDACDVHAHRASYAATLYKLVARPLEVCEKDPFFDKNRSVTREINGQKIKTRGVLCPDSVYWCRGSRRGIWYDKKALLIVSRALGHNRIDVVACHYLYSLDDEIRNMTTHISNGESVTTFEK